MTAAGRVLMVAFHFPPSGAVAAQRAHKFARYLPDFGVASYCGWGREDPNRIPSLLAGVGARAAELAR